MSNAQVQPGPALEVKGLRYSYKRTIALKGVNFSVAERSIHGFVGPNGAGKTTTLKILATLLVPQSGAARVFGHDIATDYKSVRRRIGFMPDNISLYRQMTVFESLDFFAAAYGIDVARRNRIIEDLLTLTDMQGRKNDLIKSLSRGMLQRVSLARALVHDPELLLLDEPASGLDPRARIELMEVLKELSRMGKTVFISSHILGELADLCDSVTIIDRGWTKYSGSMADLLRHGGDLPRYELGLAAEHPPVEEALRALEGVSAVTKDEGAPLYRFSFDPCRTDTNAVLAAVLASGAKVASFRESIRELGQAFMELTDPGVPT
jgi:ABC-2 type transport system ATP-binding protein